VAAGLNAMNVSRFIPIFVAVAIYIVRLREIKAKRDVIAGKVRENLTLLLFMIVGSVTFLGALAEYWLRGATFAWPWLITGVLCSICSFWLRWKAIAALGKFWSLHVEIRENHEFIRSGPFRWMRHPTYFSMILELVSFCLVLNAFYTLLIVPFIFLPALLLRLRIEEAALVEKFGDAYREYQAVTPILFPYKGPCR
jgi:protein-S-isoprenylcysteine O-methyltransferase Ste14